MIMLNEGDGRRGEGVEVINKSRLSYNSKQLPVFVSPTPTPLKLPRKELIKRYALRFLIYIKFVRGCPWSGRSCLQKLKLGMCCTPNTQQWGRRDLIKASQSGLLGCDLLRPASGLRGKINDDREVISTIDMKYFGLVGKDEIL